MWIVCITSVRHVLTVNGYGGRQTKENEKSWCFKGWETLVPLYWCKSSNISTAFTARTELNLVNQRRISNFYSKIDKINNNIQFYLLDL